MHLPPFWRQACFSVAESAELLGVPEMTLRTWLARAPFNDFLGAKHGGRVFLSGNDIWFYLLVKQFTTYGVPVRTAMYAAHGYADATMDTIPADERLAVRRRDEGKWSFEMVDDPNFGTETCLVVPLWQTMLDLIERAAAVYAKEAN